MLCTDYLTCASNLPAPSPHDILPHVFHIFVLHAQAVGYARQSLAGLPQATAAEAPLLAMLREKHLTAHVRSAKTLARLVDTSLVVVRPF